MPRRAPARMSMTSFAHSVVLTCCDPVCVPAVWHTNERARADVLFRKREARERAAGGGGEFTLRQYAHTAASRIQTMTHEDPDLNDGHPFVYAIDYPGSTVIGEFSYMDLLCPPSPGG